MSRLALMFLGAAICFADGVKKEKSPASPTPDISEMLADIHTPLFRAPQRP